MSLCAPIAPAINCAHEMIATLHPVPSADEPGDIPPGMVLQRDTCSVCGISRQFLRPLLPS